MTALDNAPMINHIEAVEEIQASKVLKEGAETMINNILGIVLCVMFILGLFGIYVQDRDNGPAVKLLATIALLVPITIVVIGVF